MDELVKWRRKSDMKKHEFTRYLNDGSKKLKIEHRARDERTGQSGNVVRQTMFVVQTSTCRHRTRTRLTVT